MTATAHVCRACAKPILDTEDAVLIAFQEGSSGSGWNIWAHRAHRYQATEPGRASLRVAALVFVGGK
ncbi:hypothetical protein GCM10010206_40550 [Streptomyces cinerochromogenes]|nr:hypothetical protein GCM10010206_40550 [Streptomyces cinerochromogenes]